MHENRIILCHTNQMIKSLLSGAALAYIVACLVYMIVAKMCLDTPFMKSLTPEQIEIKSKSAKVRKNVFMFGMGVGLIVALIIVPRL